MNAQEAKQLTEKHSKKNMDVERLLTYARGKIERAARGGLSSITHPFSGADVVATEELAEQVYKRLREDGYKVAHTKNKAKTSQLPVTVISW